ncbi:MAG TPA: hypothetical protein VGF55_12675 [Gemmataceae bacterium]
MPKPYDATTKDLIETAPADWLTFLGRPVTGTVRLIDADLSTVTTQADKVLMVDGEPPWVLHLEMQASRDTVLPVRVLKYNALLREQHGCSVSSAVVLLRPQADGAELTGLYREPHQTDGRDLMFPYQVVRVWQVPAGQILAGGVGTLPLAPVSDVTLEALPAALERMKERFAAEMSKPQAAKLWAATFVLMGLRYPRPLAEQLLQGVIAMEESVTYQAILEKGELKEARHVLLRQGGKKFGPPDAVAQAAIGAIADRQRLEELIDRVLDVASWQELFSPPA